jgi:hypothetical protein
MPFASFDAMEPEDLAVLRQVLERACHAKQIPLDGPRAQELARELVDWHLFGVTDPYELEAMLEPLLME